jgi:hypothetical protein
MSRRDKVLQGREIHMSGIEGSARASSSQSPAGPFAPHLALPNHVLRSAAGPTQLHPHSLSCGMILLCDLSRSAARALPSRRASPFRRVPSRVWLAEPTGPYLSQCCYPGAQKINLVLRDDARKGPAPRRQSRGRRAREQPMASSRTEKSMRRNSEASRLGRTRLDFEQPIYQSELKLKGAAGSSERDTQCSPELPTCLFTLPFFISTSLKNIQHKEIPGGKL